jgi:hypothetical protein
MGDLDVGDMFLNFILELKARIRAGVDLTHFIAFTKEVVYELPKGSTPSRPVHCEPDPHLSASRRAQHRNRRSAVGRRRTPP